MKKMMMFVAMAAMVGAVTGCFTRAVAYTRVNPDGSRESKVVITGTGDKASQVAAEGLFADGAADDLGAGVKKANASQQSTGIKETLEGVGVLLGGVGQLMARSQGVTAASGVTETENDTDIAATLTNAAQVVYSTEGYGGVPGVNGEGVYGRPSCGHCRAYKTAHADVAVVNIDDSANKAAMWAALRRLGYAGTSVALPVVVTADGYTVGAK